MSTHPSSDSRIQLIKDHLKDVQPLYERAKAAKSAGAPPETLRKGPLQGPTSSGSWPSQSPLSGPKQ
jgi:hypothetical protein